MSDISPVADASAAAAAAAAAGAAADVPMVDRIAATYKWALDQGDPRVRDWFLMGNPLIVVGVGLAYLFTVFALVQHTKARGKPYNVRGLSIVHNIHLMSLSFYMMYECIRQAVINNYSLFSNGVDRSEKGLGMARILWIFYLSKIVEFVDTFIMALKMNYHQITVLHLYHHVSIFWVWWIIVYYAPGGESYFSAALNSFIHVVMYGYYLWSTFSPKPAEDRRPRWTEPAFYKKYITTMQMTQFAVMMFQAGYDIVVPSEFPRFCAHILFFYMITMLALFRNFFQKSYNKGKGKKDE